MKYSIGSSSLVTSPDPSWWLRRVRPSILWWPGWWFRRARHSLPPKQTQVSSWWAATIALWIRLRLPFCSRGFKSQPQHLRFVVYVVEIGTYLKRTKNEKKWPWSSGYGRRLMFWRSWVLILVLFTGWTFFTYNCHKNCNVCLKRTKINIKRPDWLTFKKH